MEQQTLQAKRDQNDQTQERYTACLLGGAMGDALGAAVEFMSRAGQMAG
ncbi:ADP-ribosylglycohydrolase family protein [Marinobacter nauticus]|nr:ADP-ribosylglycohydrolase family protein [Marinobacter nauticus]